MAGLSTLAITNIAGAQLSARAYHYSYFKEAQSLTLDLGKIAVFTDARTAADRDITLLNKLASFDVNPASLAPTAWTGLNVAATPMWAHEDGAMRDLLTAMGKENVGQFVSPVFLDAKGHPAYVTRDLIVGFNEHVPADKAQAIIAANIPGVVLEENWSDMPGVYRIRTDLLNGLDVLALANQLAAMDAVRFAEPDMVMTLEQHVVPDDALFGEQWGLRNTGQSGGIAGEDIKATNAWDIEQGDPSVVVVILDNGVQQNHPDINQIAGNDFTSIPSPGGAPGNFCDKHGTSVAGCVSAIMGNWIGVVGVAPGSKIVSARYASSDVPCTGFGLYSMTGLVDALDWAVQIGARITVNSNGFPANSSVTMKYDQTRQQGMLHFASAGNDGSSTITYPATLSSVLAIGAVNNRGQAWINSNYGPQLGFVAPGVQVRTTDRTGTSGYSNNDYAVLDGTSFATPYAAGVAALVMSFNPDIPTDQVVNILKASATDKGTAGFDTQFGYGVVNALAALQLTPPPVPPGAFNLLSPANGATGVSQGPTFDWSDSSNAISYRVVIDNDSNFSSPLFDDFVTVSSLISQPTTFTQGVTYYWKVTATNYSGQTNSSPASASFTVSTPPPPPPGAFNLLTPNSGATNVSRNPLLDWSDSTGATSYTVTVDTEPTFSAPVTYSSMVGASQLQLPTNTLAYGTTYYWRVVASNTNGNTMSTPTGPSFTTLAAPPPPCVGDANGDRRVDFADLSVLLATFGHAVTPGSGADYNADGMVNNSDLSTLLGRFGQSC